MISENNTRIAIIGLGYVNLPLAVAHDEFVEAGAEQLRKYGKDNHVLYDIKYLLEANQVDGRL